MNKVRNKNSSFEFDTSCQIFNKLHLQKGLNICLDFAIIEIESAKYLLLREPDRVCNLILKAVNNSIINLYYIKYTFFQTI